MKGFLIKSLKIQYALIIIFFIEETHCDSK